MRLESPAYVFGDTHGNLEDLHFFSDHIWKLGVSLTAGQLLFLGDYVDRGLSSLEVVAYLLALKCLEPQKVWLLRGNHETRDVNGWEEHYGDRSFLAQCKNRLGSPLVIGCSASRTSSANSWRRPCEPPRPGPVSRTILPSRQRT